MNNVLTMILAGGQGDRLSVLSEQRAKPAVVFGGHYRIMDFTLSNCANSGVTNVAVLTQYRPRSLMNHIGSGRAWGFDMLDNKLQVLQPYLGRKDSDWYSGTADAVYQNLYVIEESRAREVLILAGDHIYLTNYRYMLDFHRNHAADVTVAVYQVPLDEAHRFGVLELDQHGQVIDFDEKPPNPRSGWVSMGIYLFNADSLVEQLIRDAERPDSSHDFGRDIIPSMYETHRVFGYRYQGYWRDVGTIDAYWNANRDLLSADNPLPLQDPELKLRTPGDVPPPGLLGADANVQQSLISGGALIRGHVERSVVSPNAVIERGAIVRDSIVQHDCVIRSGAVVDHAILDKEVTVGVNAVVGIGDCDVVNMQRPDILNTGITVVGKRVAIPSGIEIGRNVVIGPGVRDELAGMTTLESGGTVLPKEVPLHMFV